MKKVIEQKIVDTLPNNYMPYAMSVIVSRALPEIDGFKPSHRKLLYTMFRAGLLSGARTKSANVVGDTMKLNPHGDMAIYETLVRQTRGNETLLHPLVDSKGNFGKVYSRDMAFAASRYTEVKLEAICEEIFADIGLDTVDFVDNYDGKLQEPRLLPTRFPNILVNPNLGIAVGMASNICSFNLQELCNTTIKYLENPDKIDIVDELLAPDFSTGGYFIYNRTELEGIYKTGRGGFKLRAKYRYDKANNCIEVIEIPYTTTVEAIIDKFAELIKQGNLKEVSDIRDETDINGLKITIDLKRGQDADKLMTRLYKQTPLEDSFVCNFNILVDGIPRLMGVAEILEEWSKFRINCVKRQLRFEIGKMGERLHLLKGLAKILLDIDKAIQIIRNTPEDRLVLTNLMAGFAIDELQAEYVANIRLRNLNKEYILNKTAEIADLERGIGEREDTLKNEKSIKKIIIKQLKDIAKKYGKPRKTEILHIDDVQTYQVEHFIDDFALKIFLTHQNYLKKIPLVSLRTASEQKLKPDDSVICEVETTNKSDLLLFSNKHNVYKLKIHELTDTKASALGDYLPNLIGMDDGERIIRAVATNDYSGFMLFAFVNGKVAKVEMKAYATKTNRKKLANAYSSNSALVDSIFIEQDTKLVVFSNIDKCLAFDTANIAPKSTRDSQGVLVLKPKKNSYLSKIGLLENTQLSDVEYYTTKNIPAIGYYLKEQDKPLANTGLTPLV